MKQEAVIDVWGIPTCDSTRKGMRLLEKRGFSCRFRNFREIPPTRALLNEALRAVGDPGRLFNTSGAAYREGGFASRRGLMTPGEVIDALLADPMLIKRPIIRSKRGIVVGYDEEKISFLLY